MTTNKSKDEKTKRIVNTFRVEERPKWISDTNIELLTHPKYVQILRFYIVNTPDSEKSVRGKSITDCGIDETVFLKDLKKDIIQWQSSGNNIIVESKLDQVTLKEFPPKADFSERVCFSYNKREELTYFFRHIRNSIAHGRFNITGPMKDPVLAREDRNSNGNCSARMILKMSTLLRWMEQIENYRKD